VRNKKDKSSLAGFHDGKKIIRIRGGGANRTAVEDWWVEVSTSGEKEGKGKEQF